MDSGQLLNAIEDQLTKKTRLIRTLKRAQLLLSLDDFDASIPIQVDYVHDAFDGLSHEWKARTLAYVKRLIWDLHGCFYAAEESTADPAVERRLLEQWLADTQPRIASQQENLQSVAAYLPEGCPHDF